MFTRMLVLVVSLWLLCPNTGAASACGGDGERGCCIGGGQRTDNPLGAGCQYGNAEVSGCTGDCGGCSTTTCYRCGQEGVHACVGGSCDAGLTSNVFSICVACGSDGLPVCDNNQCDPGYKADVLGFCRAVEQIAEPGCNCTPESVPQDVNDPIVGFADMHAHIFANNAFGGAVLWGEAFSHLGINEALRQDDYVSRWDVIDAFGNDVPSFGFLGEPAHGLPSIDNPVGMATDFFFPSTRSLQHDHAPLGSGKMSGAPDFAGWPKWTTTTHQQMYYKWLERAFKGGLKLVVQLAVTNEMLCSVGHRQKGATCSDMYSIDRQIDDAYGMQSYIDSLHGGTGKGWFRIVTTPAEARRVISENRMAVILGIETSFLFDCKPGECDESFIGEKLDAYYDRGIRYVFPIHVFDNAFGGTAFSNPLINIGNRITTGDYFSARDCSGEGYSFNLDEGSPAEDVFLELFGLGAIPDYSASADCNSRGLTPLGESLIRKLMARNMIIDTDHMSNLSLGRVLEIAESVAYPLTAGHSQYEGGSEFSRSRATMERILRLGGMLAPGVFGYWEGTEIGDIEVGCRLSSEGFGSYFQFATRVIDELADGDNPLGINAVAMGTDFNGMTLHPSPRFGSDACAAEGEVAGAAAPITYPFDDGRFGSFNKQVTGKRTFDYNYDGLAHVGLLPDFIEDLRLVGVTEEQLDSLYNSAEGFVRMWEIVESLETTPPSVEVVQSPGGGGWHNDRVKVSATGIPGLGSGLRSVVVELSGADSRTLTHSSALEVWLEVEGRTQVTVYAVGEDGSESQKTSFDVRIDRTPPTINLASLPPANDYGWYNTDIEVTFQCSDQADLSGVSQCTTRLEMRQEGADQSALGEVIDRAGNRSEMEVGGINIDKTPPVSTPEPYPPANSAGWNREAVQVEYGCFDSLSGPNPNTCQLPDSFSSEGVHTGSTAAIEDLAGNVAVVTDYTIRIDKTPPVITAGRSPLANVYGWVNTDVTVSFECNDELSGVGYCQANEVFSTELANQISKGTVKDLAGNTSSLSLSGISIDKTPPTISYSRSPSANEFGWNNEDVHVNFTCTDGLSGVLNCSEDVVFSAEGAGQQTLGIVMDLAGNVGKLPISGISIDKTGPTLLCQAYPDVIWPPDNKLVPVNIDVVHTDALSGTRTFFLAGLANSQGTTGALVDFALLTDDVSGAVMAARTGGDARTYTFGYEGSDLAGNTAQCETMVLVPANQAPVANGDAYTASANQALNVGAPGVLGNDTDTDGDALQAILVSGASQGSLTLNPDGSFSYTPNAGASGSDSFRYKANDGNAASNTVTVPITIEPALSQNSAPVANSDAYTASPSQTLNVAAPGVLGNDADTDGNTLQAILVSTTSQGSLTLNPDGSFSYTPQEV